MATIVPPSGLEVPGLEHSTGRRSALARWVTHADHPLTARVAVNRVWQWVFGVGIVPTTSDFGATGEPASHRELLDWLAVDFVEHGWSLKRLHRRLVTSATYRQASRVDLNDTAHLRGLQRDPANRWLWHAARRRLDGEAIRDAMLQVSGQLNPRMYGPSARPALPANLSSQPWKPDDVAYDQQRRSIYVFKKRNLRYPLFEVHDGPDLHQSCPRRAVTTTSAQALVMLNSELSWQAARYWAGRLLTDKQLDERPANSDHRQANLQQLVERAYHDAFAREASHDEITLAHDFITAATRRWASRNEAANAFAPLRSNVSGEAAVDSIKADALPLAVAVVEFCHALLNANEFVYVD
jgi:hypothetical protein